MSEPLRLPKWHMLSQDAQPVRCLTLTGKGKSDTPTPPRISLEQPYAQGAAERFKVDFMGAIWKVAQSPPRVQVSHEVP